MRSLDYPSMDLIELAQLGPTEVLVLTVNNRLARTVTEQLAGQIASGSAQLVPIKPWSAWLGTTVLDVLYEANARGLSQVLDTQTTRLIWADVIGQVEADRSLIDVDQVAALAAEADALLINWHIDVPAAWHTPDFKRFVAWRAAYETRLTELQATDLARLSGQVSTWVMQGRFQLPAQVVLMGFTEVSAAMQTVLDAMRDAGVKIAQLVLPEPGQRRILSKQAMATPIQEWAQAIQWARGRLEANSKGRFAIVVPDLQAQATQARRLLSRDLGHAFNVAVAPALSHWPLARAMLAWLRLVIEFEQRGRVAPQMAGQALIAGGCAGSQTEAGARALIDARWRERQYLSVTLARWNDDLNALPKLSQAWQQAWAVWFDAKDTASSWFDWANRFRQVLAALGFPGEGVQSSVQYQTTAAIDQLLSALAALDDCLSPPDAPGAWRMLSRLATQTLFQPQRDRHARLDVLGLLEAEGGRWDGVWVMGVTDEVLPAVVRPNPLIPIQALVRAGAPRSTAQREYQWASELMQALQHSAPEVIFSWPERDGEQPQRPSPFLLEIPWVVQSQSDAPEPIETVQLVGWMDEESIPIMPTERMTGGVSVLQTQAQNPKWAFFRYRLGAQGMPAYRLWPTGADRGNLLHRVMQTLWERWGNQAHMMDQVSQADWRQTLFELVNRTASHVLEQWPSALRELEVQRAIEVIEAWLRIEADRLPFRVIERESKHPFREGELALNLTIDRIDELASGQLVVIDYKTGSSVPTPKRDWQPLVRSDLQLLVYASLLRAQNRIPEALVWAHLHAGQPAMHGLADDAVELPNVKHWSDVDWAHLPWQEQLQDWDRQVLSLAQAFAQGLNDNRFWRASDANYCGIKPLLKLYDDIELEAEDD